MGNIDHITDLEQGLLDLSLKAVTCKLLRPSALACTECGNVVLERRHKTLPGAQVCVSCREMVAVRQRNFGGRA